MSRRRNGIPVVGVSETGPPKSTYQDWMMGQLNARDKALAGALLAAALALAEAWGGLTLAFYTDWPTSFWMTALSGLVYLASLAARFRSRRGIAYG